MANPSFILNAVPMKIDATHASVDFIAYTSRGNAMRVQRVITIASYTVGNLYAAIKAIVAAIQNPPAPDAASPYVGVRFDATAGSPTPLAAVDTPVDTGNPPVAGG